MDEAIQKAQRVRLSRFRMATGTYAMITLTTFLTQQLGLGRMTAAQWAAFLGIALAGNLGFFFIFLRGWNLRFRDPSLTREQIVYSVIWGLWAVYHLPQARPVLWVLFYVPAFCFGILRLKRWEYFKVAAILMGLYGALLVLEYTQGRPGFRVDYELFLFCIFGILFTWLAFFGGFVSDLRRRLRVQNLQIQRANEEIRKEVEHRKKAEAEKDTLLEELREALARVKTLKGLIPICAWCKKIRDDTGYWQQLEAYLRDHSEAELSHGICPECASRFSMGLMGEDPKARDGH